MYLGSLRNASRRDSSGSSSGGGYPPSLCGGSPGRGGGRRSSGAWDNSRDATSGRLYYTYRGQDYSSPSRRRTSPFRIPPPPSQAPSTSRGQQQSCTQQLSHDTMSPHDRCVYNPRGRDDPRPTSRRNSGDSASARDAPAGNLWPASSNGQSAHAVQVERTAGRKSKSQ